MIIQSLVSLYDRLAKDSDVQLPSFGYSEQKISFALVLGLNGNLVQVKDLRVEEGNKLRPKMMLMPYVGRSGQGFSPQFVWDNTQYVLGCVAWDEKDKKRSKEKAQRAMKAFKVFRKYHKNIFEGQNIVEVQAMLKFLDLWDPSKIKTLDQWEEMLGVNVVFMIDGQRRFIHELEQVNEIWKEIYAEIEQPDKGQCLLTGRERFLARLHPMIKNVDGAQAKGATIASFNKDSFCSYNKEQSYNSPLNVDDAFKYGAVLNYLLRRDSHNKQRIRIGDTTTIFWTDRKSPLESFLGYVFDPRDDCNDSDKIKIFLEAVKRGVKPDIPGFDGDVLFYVLGLAPNNSRLAVRFWYVSTVEVLEKNIGKHFQHLEMERQWDKDPLNPGIWHLLKETARETKDISPLLGGSLMRSVLEGARYPMNLFNGVLNRIRADQRINYLRAAICKAVLTRNFKMEVLMTLDTGKKDIAYLLGRLFAVLEKAQQDAIPGANATIKDRFYGSASATPASVFPRLLRLSQHHISKAEYGHVSDKRIAGIMENITNFPEHMDLKQQGLFAIGYYQQRNALFQKKVNKQEAEEVLT